MKKITTTKLVQMKKESKKIVALTCYSYSTARIINKVDIDIVLVGDSLGMVELGYENTIPVTLKEMLHHTKAVARSKPNALLVTDMPFMSFNISESRTLRNAGRFIKEGGAEAIKLEGGKEVAEITNKLVQNNIPVMGHLGLTPQSIHKMGGYKVQGKTAKQAEILVRDAKILEEAGSFAVVLEGIPSELAKTITESISIPTIGIGAGPYCDGQILVVNDMLGMDTGFKPVFVRRYAQLEKIMEEAFTQYGNDIRKGSFPSKDESY